MLYEGLAIKGGRSACACTTFPELHGDYFFSGVTGFPTGSVLQLNSLCHEGGTAIDVALLLPINGYRCDGGCFLLAELRLESSELGYHVRGLAILARLRVLALLLDGSNTLASRAGQLNELATREQLAISAHEPQGRVAGTLRPALVIGRSERDLLNLDHRLRSYLRLRRLKNRLIGRRLPLFM